MRNETPHARPDKRTWRAALIRSRWLWVLAFLILAGIAYRLFTPSAPSPTGARGRGPAGEAPLPVTVAAARKGDVSVYLRALGTVTPLNTVTVRSQVGGQLLQVHFREGDRVQAGELLAEIDPRPFQVQLTQAEGQLLRDQALLKNAEIDLARYRLLLTQDAIAAQQVTTQEALVEQYRGNVKTDQGQIASANLQLTYSRIVSPIPGRIGLRLVDPGNMVQVSDATGIAVITQIDPITVIFSVPQSHLPKLLTRQKGKAPLPVYAYSQDGKSRLAEGVLTAVDNQIDTTTGTVKLRARFANAGEALFANQFVNVALKVDTLRNATVVPAAAIQRGAIETFVYVVKPERTVTVRPLKLGPVEDDGVVVEKGLEPGEVVVLVGGDKLREGTKVEVVTDQSARNAPAGRAPAGGPGAGRRARP